MSQITCCPACGTMFRVVADQLRISEGWVRCGHCAEVFDATAQLQDGVTAAGPVAQVKPTTQTEGAGPSDAAEQVNGAEPDPLEDPDGAVRSSEHAERGAHAGDESPRSPALPERPSVAQEPSTLTPETPQRFQPSVIETDASPSTQDPVANSRAARRVADSTSSLVPSGWSADDDEHGYPPIELRRADSGDDEPEGFFTPPDVNSGWTAPEVPDEEQAAQDVSFIRDARRREFWRRPIVRLAGAALALLLLLVLVAQFAVHDRHRLASVHPQLAPVLRALCQPLGCSIGPLQRIDAVAIDSSAFNKLRPDVYRLSVSLKNQAAAAVAMPSLELTLTDAQDQPVLRRVLAPREMGATSEVIPGNGEWSGVVSLSIANGSAERIAGYRLLAFYP